MATTAIGSGGRSASGRDSHHADSATTTTATTAGTQATGRHHQWRRRAQHEARDAMASAVDAIDPPEGGWPGAGVGTASSATDGSMY